MVSVLLARLAPVTWTDSTTRKTLKLGFTSCAASWTGFGPLFSIQLRALSLVTDSSSLPTSYCRPDHLCRRYVLVRSRGTMQGGFQVIGCTSPQKGGVVNEGLPWTWRQSLWIRLFAGYVFLVLSNMLMHGRRKLGTTSCIQANVDREESTAKRNTSETPNTNVQSPWQKHEDRHTRNPESNEANNKTKKDLSSLEDQVSDTREPRPAAAVQRTLAALSLSCRASGFLHAKQTYQHRQHLSRLHWPVFRTNLTTCSYLSPALPRNTTLSWRL